MRPQGNALLVLGMGCDRTRGKKTGIPSPMKVTDKGCESQVLSGFYTLSWWEQLPGALLKEQRALWLIGKVTQTFSSINRFNG